MTKYNGSGCRTFLQSLRTGVEIRHKAIWLVVFVLFVADSVTTHYGLQNGFAEMNPYAVNLMEEYGRDTTLVLLVPIKIAATMVCAASWYAITSRFDKQKYDALLPAMALTMASLPPVWNSLLLLS